jgi:hypothetical protein
MRLFLRIALIIFGILTLIALIALVLPKEFAVERSIEINAPKSLVMEQTMDFKNFHIWSPWSKLDQNMELDFFGTPMQVGSGYSWKGNKDAGSGRQEIIAITPDRADINLTFQEPFESNAKTYYLFNENNGVTTVAWGMNSQMPWPMNLMNSAMKKSIGKDYDEGLQNLKARCELMATEAAQQQNELIEMDDTNPIND